MERNCWKPLAEIYTTHSFAQLSMLNVFVNNLTNKYENLPNVCLFLPTIGYMYM